MPELSRFMGMSIMMFWMDHESPHIHVTSAEYKCKIDLNGNLLKGSLPTHKLHIVKRWIAEHNDELNKAWLLVRDCKHPERIQPWI